MSRIDAAIDDLHALDQLGARATPLQHLDPRARVAVTLAFIGVVVSFERHSLAALLPLLLYPAAIAEVGGVPWRIVLRRLLPGLPFAVMVGLFNPLLEREVHVVVAGVAISDGWLSFTSILLRYALTMSAALLLVATTGFHTVCAALAAWGVPRVFTNQLLFLYRYAFVLAGEAARLARARALRAPDAPLRLATYGSLAGQLLLRAFDRAARVHRAMLARGFDGEVRVLRRLAWTTRDALFLALCLAAFLLARAIDLPHALGALVVGSAA
ncbi:MAG: cobalt ECF transporter T component CbiQ [Steroidobacteraceae bacterium]